MKTKCKTGYVDSWYDKHQRSWVTQKKDLEGNQIGDAIYCASRQEMLGVHSIACKLLNGTLCKPN